MQDKFTPHQSAARARLEEMRERARTRSRQACDELGAMSGSARESIDVVRHRAGYRLGGTLGSAGDRLFAAWHAGRGRLEPARRWAEPRLETARDRLAPRVAAVRAWAGPHLATRPRQALLAVVMLLGVALGAAAINAAATGQNQTTLTAARGGVPMDEAALLDRAALADRADRANRAQPGDEPEDEPDDDSPDDDGPDGGGARAAAPEQSPEPEPEPEETAETQTAAAEPAPAETRQPDWTHPMPGAATTSCYGPRWGTMHAGVDLAAPHGTPIRAVGAGTVIHSGWAFAGYGISVVIHHPNGYQTHYAHASEAKVSVGDQVTPGQIIALEGSTGDSTGPHLHFEVHRGLWNQLEPTGWLRERGVTIGGC